MSRRRIAADAKYTLRRAHPLPKRQSLLRNWHTNHEATK